MRQSGTSRSQILSSSAVAFLWLCSSTKSGCDSEFGRDVNLYQTQWVELLSLNYAIIIETVWLLSGKRSTQRRHSFILILLDWRHELCDTLEFMPPAAAECKSCQQYLQSPSFQVVTFCHNISAAILLLLHQHTQNSRPCYSCAVQGVWTGKIDWVYGVVSSSLTVRGNRSFWVVDGWVDTNQWSVSSWDLRMKR